MNHYFSKFTATAFLTLCPGLHLAAEVAVPPAPTPALLEQNATVAATSFEQQLKDVGFAAGIAAVFMDGEREVDNAAVENGVIRTDFKSKDRIGGILEAHYLFGDLAFSGRRTASKAAIKEAVKAQKPTVANDFAAGIMVGAELGENAIRSLGIGVLVSFRRFDVDASGRLSPKVAFNLGVMALREQNVKMLADGFHDGSALPAGATAVRFKEDSRSGYALIFSAGF